MGNSHGKMDPLLFVDWKIAVGKTIQAHEYLRAEIGRTREVEKMKGTEKINNKICRRRKLNAKHKH